MDYEKILKEALNSKATPFEVSSWIEEQFPELKESEDERTWIINYLSNRILNSTIIAETENLKKAIAWLEKQGEQKLYVNDNAKEMFIRALERVEEQNNKGYKLTDCDKNSWWEDFKAYTSCIIVQKPAEKYEPMSLDEAIEHCKEKSCGNNACALEHKQLEKWLTELKALKEQKPARSEEDEEALEVAIIALEDMYSEESPLDCYAGHHMPFDKAANQLKSLKERIQPQFKWSEEDCNQIETIACHLDNIGNGAMAESLLNIMDKYKSLRPQNAWKPSDEQIDALVSAIDIMIDNRGAGDKKTNLLSGLYHELKTL